MCRNATYMRIWPNVRLELQNKKSYSSLKLSWKSFNDDDLGVAYDFIWIFLILMATYLWFCISLADGKTLRPNKMYKHENVLNYFPAFLGIKASFTSPNYENAEQNPTYMSISWKIISEDWRPLSGQNTFPIVSSPFQVTCSYLSCHCHSILHQTSSSSSTTVLLLNDSLRI